MGVIRRFWSVCSDRALTEDGQSTVTETCYSENRTTRERDKCMMLPQTYSTFHHFPLSRISQ